MTTPTISDPPPDAETAPANEPPITSKFQPPIAVPAASSNPDLQSRIQVRRGELKAKLGDLKADLRLGASETRDRLRAKLSELAHILKWGVVDDWASLGDNMKRRLEHWLGETAPPRAAKDEPAPPSTDEVGQS